MSEDRIPDIKRVQVALNTLRDFKDEEDFNGLGVDLLVEVNSFTGLAACLLPGDTKCWNRNQAVLGGLLVRLYKLLSAILDQTCQHRRETSFMFARLAFECIINIQYFIAKSSDEIYEAYIAYSLRHERKLRDMILEEVRERDGEPLPIEKRMLASIERSARTSNISLDDLNPSRWKKWSDSTIFDRADSIGLGKVYLEMFGGPSHTVHGNWQDLLEYHLEDLGCGFGPELAWHNPRPQLLFAIGIFTVDMLKKYLLHFAGENADKMIRELDDLLGRLILSDKEHERFLTERQTA
jgi:hypothetical protein